MKRNNALLANPLLDDRAFKVASPNLVPRVFRLLTRGSGLSSSHKREWSKTTPSCGKTKDPGNEVVPAQAYGINRFLLLMRQARNIGTFPST